MSNKRNELMIMQDRAMVCELMLKGYSSHAEIAAKINSTRDHSHVTLNQVKADIRWMEKKLLEKGLEDLHAKKKEIEASIKLLKRTYWEGYELSRKRKITIESVEVINNPNDYEDRMEEGIGDDEEKQRAAKIREESRGEGNVTFLNGVLSCDDRLIKLYNIDSPDKIALTDPTGQKSLFSPLEDMKQLLSSLAPKPQELPEYVDGTVYDDESTDSRDSE